MSFPSFVKHLLSCSYSSIQSGKQENYNNNLKETKETVEEGCNQFTALRVAWVGVIALAMIKVNTLVRIQITV